MADGDSSSGSGTSLASGVDPSASGTANSLAFEFLVLHVWPANNQQGTSALRSWLPRERERESARL